MKHQRFPAIGRLLAVLFLSVALCSQVSAQTTIGRQLVDQFPTTAWGTPTYGLTWLPTDYNTNTSAKYPLIIFLHGSGEGGDGVGGLYTLITQGLPMKIAQGMNPEAVNPVDGQNYKFIVVSPQAPGAAHWSYSWGQLQYIIPDIMARYRVDPSRVYVTGLSAGGAGSWSCVTNGPTVAQKFAAIVPVSCAGTNSPSEMDSIPLVGGVYGTKVWSVCGANDAWLSFSNNATNLYNNANPAPSVPAVVTALPGVSHEPGAWNTPYDINWRSNALGLNIFEWMLKYTRSGITLPGLPLNIPPVANAGAAQTITLPTNSVTISGSATDVDGTIASYAWSQVSGPNTATIVSGASASTSVSGLVQGTYTFKLTATDNRGGTGTATTTVTVNAAPVQVTYKTLPGRVEAESYVTMNGILTETTSDAGGGLNVGYQDNGDWMDYNVNASAAGTYTVAFRLASLNGGGQFQLKNSAGTVLATVNIPSTGWWQTWQTVTANVILPQGNQTLRLYTLNAGGGWNLNWMDFSQAAVAPVPPTVSAGSDQTVMLPTNSTTLTGTASSTTGTIASYTWTEVSGPSQVSMGNASTVSITGLVQGTYTFKLTATDNQGASSSATVNVVVNAQSTTTSSTIHIEAENYTAQNGIQTENTSDVGGGKNVGYQDQGDWMDYSVNVPSAGAYNVNLRIATLYQTAQVQIKNASGTVLSTINVTPSGGYQVWSTITGTITLPAGQQTLRLYTSSSPSGWNINWWELVGGSTTTTNQVPTVNAGSAQTITLPVSSVTLTGSATDPDGTIASYRWSQVSGPNTATIVSATSASTSVSGLAQGTYTFKLTATDNQGATGSATVSVTVNAQAVTSTTIHIEAESYTSQNGILTENTSDAGGGLNVGYQDAGDWMDYNVNVPATGTYTVSLRIATLYQTAQVQLKNSAGTVLSTINVTPSGGYQVWSTITATVNLTAGQQTLRLYTSSSPSGWNLNWWEISGPGSGTARTQSTEEVSVDSTLSNAVSVKIYPNPVQDNFTLKLDNQLTGKVKVEVVSVSGQVVKTYSLNKNAKGATQFYLLASGIAKGNYVVRVTMNEWSEVSKIVKE